MADPAVSDDALIAEWKNRQAAQPAVGGDTKQLLEEFQRRKVQPATEPGVVAKPGQTLPPTSFQQRLNRSAEDVIRDFAGRDIDVDYTAEAPWFVRYQVGRMDNPSEVKAYLKKYYKESDFGQDRGGRWWIKEGGKKVPIDVGLLPETAASAPVQGGAMVGGALGGSLGGPAGAIAGTGLGAAGGKAVDEISKFLQGTLSKTPEEEVSALGGEVAINSGMSALGPLGRGTSQLAKTKFFGVTPESARTGSKLLERGVRPPIGSIAPESSSLERKRQLSAVVSGDMHKKERTGYIDQEMRGILASTGMNPQEIETAMEQIRNNAVVIEGRPAAEGIVEAVQRRVGEMDDRISGNLELAQRALSHQETAVRAWADAPVGRLSMESAEAVRQARAAVSATFNRLYDDVDQLAGNAHVVDLTDAIREADNISRQYDFAPGALPQPIRNLLQRGDRIERSRQRVEELMRNGNPVPPDLMEWANREVNIASIAEAHALRSELRESAKMWNLPNLTPEASYAMLSAVEDHVDNAFTTLANSRDPAMQLGAEAARNLRQVDRQYREAIGPFKSAVLRKIERDARSQLTPDPEVVAKFIMRPGQDEATTRILSYLTPEARTDVGRAHLRGLIGDASYRNEQNRVVLDGRKFLDLIAKNERPMNRLHPPEFMADLRRFGAELAAKDGQIEVGALRDPTAVRDMLRRWSMEREAREAFVRDNPIAALNSSYGPNVDAALDYISAPKREAQTESTFALLRPDQRQQVQQWAIKTLFQSAMKETPDRGVAVDGSALRKWTGHYTERQLDMLLGHGVANDILELGNDARFLFPDREMSPGSSQAEVSVTSKFFFNPIALSKRISWYLTTLAVHQPQVLRWFADIHQKDPGKARQLMGAFGRWAVNAESSGPGSGRPPQENLAGGNQLPKFAGGAVVTQPTVAMIGEAGPEAVVPLDDPAAAQQVANQARAAQPTGAQPTGAQPTGALPIEPSNFLADADPAQQAQQAREVAAQRQRQAVQPAEGRQEGAFTDALFDALIPGRAAVRSLTQGQYGQAAVEAGASAMPYAGKALGAAVQAAPMLTKAVAASTAALTSLFMDTSEGASKLSPEDQSRIRMMQEKSKQEQQNRAKDAELRKKEADEKADRDAKAAQAAAQTQADLQAKLAQIEADKQREQARIEEEHKAAEQRAAEETIKANAAENKRMAERPFREKHPDADLGMFMGGIAAAAILPGARQAYKQWAFNTYLKDWEKLDAVAAQALKTGTREEQQLAVNRLTAAAAELAKREGKLEKYPWVTQLGAPAIAVEMSMLPAEIDIRQPYGTKAHESAVDYYSDPATYAGLGLVGAGGFGLGHYAHELAEGVIPRGKIPTGTEGTIKTFAERNTAEALAAETAAKKKAEAAAKRKATLEAKKKAEAKEEPRKAKVPRGGSKIYGLKDE